MTARLRFTEYLDLDLDEEVWRCNRCDAVLISAREEYKRGCLVYDRDPREIHPPLIEGDYTFPPIPNGSASSSSAARRAASRWRRSTCHRGIRSPLTSPSTSTG